MVRDTNQMKKCVEALILSTPIGMHGYDLVVEYVFHKSLKFFKEFENFILMMNKIKPQEFIKVINEANIVLCIVKGINCMTPNIRVHQL
jgi:hypothetical protein